MNEFAIIPDNGVEGFVELSRTAKGKIFEKHILNYGDLYYPGVAGGKVHIDEQWADKLIANFNNKVCPIVQVPLANDQNEHSEAPDRNVGEVVGLVKRNNKIYARIDARKHEDDFGKTLLGASAMLHLNYKDTKTQTTVGPTLLHVAVTNRPYVTDLEDYSEVLSMSSDGTSEAVILTAEKLTTNVKDKKPMTLDEILVELKDDHNIDVRALQEKAKNADAAVALSNKIQEELVGTGLLKLTNGEEVTSDALIGAVAEAGDRLAKSETTIVELSNRVDTLVKDSTDKDAKSHVEGLVKGGFILPKDQDAMVELRLSNSDLFDRLIPEKPIVKLSQENGEDKPEDKPDEKTVENEIARLSAAPAAAAYIRNTN